MIAETTEHYIRLPALCTAHSHAFQRGLRGQGQRRGPQGSDDFWSWRTAMYELASSLDPDRIYEISRVAYRELHRLGVRTVGEFHYVHHQPDGHPYQKRTAMADAVIRAARDEHLRISLLRVIYARGGPGRAPEGAQRRFSDAKLDQALGDVDQLISDYGSDPDIVIGVAPHSVRAVPPDWLRPIGAFAEERAIPVHMHLAEQPKEIVDCQAETGCRPVQLCDREGLLSSRFVAVHATHLGDGEAAKLGAAGAMVCLCPTTERDLGDGLADVSALDQAGVEICVGVDSHVITDPLEDVRGVELGERLRTLRRVVLGGSDRTTAQWLWQVGSIQGDKACGFETGPTRATIDYARNHPALHLVPPDALLDAIVFGCPSSAVAP